ncbi:protein prenylyltransferase [Suillus bovinus]|uniref:protein prenylyltransferase n=1 Tax=Suillus bovinus TaxID=48563 RepID=UPI001B861F1D|nr:protein prenylyltransferase [Suillus bovinus]KAG2159116.1 protein prenylyltransferase [Suillus bovinus]
MTDASVSTCFRSLSSLLFKPPATIEVLPGDASIWIPDVAERSRSPFLFMKNNLGVPEKELRRSYLFAVPIFSAARKAFGLHTLETPSNHTTSSAIQDLIDSSAVLILMNPAHHTALNARRQLLVQDLIDVGQELKFTAALLSSRHCCKQGELWYHRRWLLRRIYPISSFSQGLVADVVPDSPNFHLPPSDLSVEIDLVTRACELYPRNYFGWTHRTVCIRSALVAGVHYTTSDVFTEILQKEIISIMQWIESHISDYSAVHHIKTLAHLTEDMESAFLPDSLLSVLGHAIALVRAFPEHETLWQYLRVFWDEGDVATAFVASFVLPLQSTRTEQENESPRGVQHACHFLEWRSKRLK